MSYILEALNKAELERRIGTVPSLASGASFMIAPRKATRRSGAFLLVGAGMLVTGLALGNLRSWQNAPVAPPVELAAASPAIAPVSAAASSKVAPKTQANKAESKHVTPGKAAPSAAAVGKPKVLAEVAATDAELLTPVVAGSPQEAGVVSVVTAGAVQRVVAFRELPAKLKKQLPQITFGGLAGVDEAEVKIAFINNRLVKEGEELSHGLRLEKVSSEGVVLAYQGHHFRP